MSGWISVKDRLPENDDEVLGFARDDWWGRRIPDWFLVVKYYPEEKRWCETVEGMYTCVSHWMPLISRPNLRKKFGLLIKQIPE